ncbi:MAG: hypothetical protein ACE5G3_01315 [Gammaproteobacteria bacterium]
MSAQMDRFFRSVIGRVEWSFPLTEIELDTEIARPRSFLKILDANHYNWRAERFRKLFGMRAQAEVPLLDQLNFIFYPESVYDTPIFLCFALLTKHKLIAHLNVYCPFDDEVYLARHVDPLTGHLQRYPPFEYNRRYPEWMQKYRHPCAIYGMFSRDRIEDFSDCAHDYLGHYLGVARDAQPVEDAEKLATIADFHAQFVRDVRTKDKAQDMLAKMIGKEPARRIFYEITT